MRLLSEKACLRSGKPRKCSRKHSRARLIVSGLSSPVSSNSEYRAEHYKAFADALPHHAALLNHLGQAQAQVQETRVALQETKDSLGSKRADLVQLWARGQTLEEMMRLLDQMCVELFRSHTDAE